MSGRTSQENASQQILLRFPRALNLRHVAQIDLLTPHNARRLQIDNSLAPRRGLKRQINEVADGWKNPRGAERIFSQLEGQSGEIKRFGDELERLQQRVGAVRRRLALPDAQLGQKR